MTRWMLASLLLAAALPQAASADDWRRGHDDRHYGRERVVRCDSNDNRSRYCPVDTRGGVALVRQRSDAACIRGRTWGHDRRGIWVSHGCRADFALDAGRRYRDDRRRYDDRYDDRYGYGYRGRAQVVRCESNDDRSNFCRVPGGVREVDIKRVVSRANCDYGYSWGFRRDGIWVDRGCRADFVVF